jgi:pyruvate carboxylase subunit B
MNKNMPKQAIAVTDTTFRDAHQSSLATRMHPDDMLPIAEKMDEVGFHSLEVWGGATFDVATRFLNVDPWQWLKTLKKHITRTPLQMLLRGQNLVGYRHYADDVVRAFVHRAAACGMDIFRVFDALNDERNFEQCFNAIRECGKHIQGTICYSLTGRRLGGPVFTIDYFVKKAEMLETMGAHSLCIKDMAGLMSPFDAFDLVSALKKAVSIPIQLHSHYTSGMASMTYLKAIEAGIDVVDTALAPLALRSSQPAIEPLVVTLQDTPWDTGFNLSLLDELGRYLESVLPKYIDFINNTKMSVIDASVLLHQIPGGMLSNLVSQLKEANALHRIDEVYDELPRTRKDLGYPPLVTPTSQIVGTQAVQNVLFGRYQMVSSQVKDYAYGLYGRPPVPMDPEVQRKCLKGYARGETPIDCRPADILAPELEKAREEVKDLTRDDGDILIYALYPTTGKRFLRWKYGLEPVPESIKPKTTEDKERAAAAREGTPVHTREEKPTREDTSVKGAAVAEDAKNMSGMAGTAAEPGEISINAPMPGIIIACKVREGETIKSGDIVVVLEAMKMENDLASPVDGTVKKIACTTGASVKKDDLLCIISTKR